MVNQTFKTLVYVATLWQIILLMDDLKRCRFEKSVWGTNHRTSVIRRLLSSYENARQDSAIIEWRAVMVSHWSFLCTYIYIVHLQLSTTRPTTTSKIVSLLLMRWTHSCTRRRFKLIVWTRVKENSNTSACFDSSSIPSWPNQAVPSPVLSSAAVLCTTIFSSGVTDRRFRNPRPTCRVRRSVRTIDFSSLCSCLFPAWRHQHCRRAGTSLKPPASSSTTIQSADAQQLTGGWLLSTTRRVNVVPNMRDLL